MSKPKPLSQPEITFAQQVALGKSYFLAAEIAGIKGYGQSAHQIAKRPRVAKYIDELVVEMKEKSSKYLEEGVAILWQAARDQGTVNALARALELIAKIDGKFDTKKEDKEIQPIQINYMPVPESEMPGFEVNEIKEDEE